VTHTVIDALSYRVRIHRCHAARVRGTGVASKARRSIRRSPTRHRDRSLCRMPDGQDTNNAAADWKICATLDTRRANAP